MYKEIEEADGIWIYDDGRVWSVKRNKFLPTSSDGKGYLKVSLWADGKVKTIKIHRLVAKYFVPNPNNFKEVNHIDENKANNNKNNLEWCDRKYNINYGTNRKRAALSNRNNSCSKRVCQYNVDGTFIKEYPSLSEASRQMNKKSVHGEQNISMCAKGVTKTAYGYIWKFSNYNKEI